jgi:dienelactone hydrolase
MAIGAAHHGPSMTGNRKFAAHVALYPGCAVESIVKGGSEAPILILLGDKDTYTSVRACSRLRDDGVAAGRKVTLKVYPGAYHAWD